MFLRSVTRLFHSTSHNASGTGSSGRVATPSISQSFAKLKEFMGVLKGNKRYCNSLLNGCGGQCGRFSLWCT
jgi:hypothetical protein